MRLFPIFRRKNKEPSKGRVLLAVLYVAPRESVSTEQAHALRQIILTASPLYLDFLNPGSFIVFFPGTDKGNGMAIRLAEDLRQYARQNSIEGFGVGTCLGDCIAQFNSKGSLVSRPLGIAINDAMSFVIQDGKKNAR